MKKWIQMVLVLAGTWLASVAGNYVGTASALSSWPLSGPNTIMILVIGSVVGLIVAVPAIILALVLKARVLTVNITATILGFIMNLIGMYWWVSNIP